MTDEFDRSARAIAMTRAALGDGSCAMVMLPTANVVAILDIIDRIETEMRSARGESVELFTPAPKKPDTGCFCNTLDCEHRR